MRILYGVVGEGMGHATRSRVIIEHLLSAGHAVHVVVSGKAHGFLSEVFAGRERFSITEIAGLRLVQDADGIDRSESLWVNLAAAPDNLRHNLQMYLEVASRFSAEVVISDFESWAYLYARAHELPVISIDNIQVLHRCAHADWISGTRSFNFLLARYSAKAKMARAYHFLVTTFFTPPVRKPRTTLVPPILRPEVLAAVREPGDHILVYQHAPALEALLPVLHARTDQRFVVYGLGERESAHAHIIFRPFSQTGFVDDLRTARGAIAGGGFSLMSECVHLQVPLLAVPLADQFEQELNARYLDRLGYGAWAEALDDAVVDRFLADLPRHTAALKSWRPRDNSMTLACLDELLERVRLGDRAPESLQTPALGDIVSAATDAILG